MSTAEIIGIVYMVLGLLFMLIARWTLKDAIKTLHEAAAMLGIDLKGK